MLSKVVCFFNNPEVRNLSLYLAVRGVNGAVAISAIGIFSRLLTPYEYGQYLFWMMVVTTNSSLFYQWISHAVARYYPSLGQYQDEYISAVGVSVLFSLVINLLFAVAFSFFSEVAATKIFLVYMTSASLGVYTILLQEKNSKGKHFQYAILSILMSVLPFTFGFLCIVFLKLSYESLIICLLITNFFLICFFYETRRFSTRKINEIVRYSFPIWTSTIFVLVVDVSDKFMIAHFLGMEELSYYTVPYQLTQQIVGVLFSVVFLVYFPKLVSFMENKTDKGCFVKYGIQYVALFLFIALACVAFFVFSAPDLAYFVFGEGLRGKAIYIMPYIAIAIITCSFKVYVVDLPAKLHKKSSFIFASSVVMAIVNLVFNAFFIPFFGVKGALFSTILAFSIGIVVGVYNVIFNFERNVFFIRDVSGDMVRILIIFISGYAVLYFVNTMNVFSVIDNLAWKSAANLALNFLVVLMFGLIFFIPIRFGNKEK